MLGGCSVTVGVNEQDATHSAPAAVGESSGWRETEKGILENHVQLTFSDRFVKAGEAYFSPDGKRIIFQAVEVPPEGREPAEFYAMFVADLARSGSGHVTGITNIRRLSPSGSANTCGWFHPDDAGLVLFASTLVPPTSSHPPGYQRSSGRYRWMFPPEMKIVQVRLDEADGTAAPLEVLVDREDAYVAEATWSPDGRHLLYCSLQSGDGDLYIKDLQTGRTALVVGAKGYDGGPFFSPEGRRICYRSDRHGDHRLQIFVGELAFNEDGEIVGLEREHQLTANEHVNWCPYWDRDGCHLIYATSEVGHHNYEVFAIDADPGDRPGSTGTIRYGTGIRRVTHAEGSDVLPAFNADGTMMMWTSRRSEDGSVQLWLADFVMDLNAGPGGDESRGSSH
jgi:Tol biopolymer transport system component